MRAHCASPPTLAGMAIVQAVQLLECSPSQIAEATAFIQKDNARQRAPMVPLVRPEGGAQAVPTVVPLAERANLTKVQTLIEGRVC